jgi:hypothetical protein
MWWRIGAQKGCERQREGYTVRDREALVSLGLIEHGVWRCERSGCTIMSQDSERAKKAGGSQLNACNREVPNPIWKGESASRICRAHSNQARQRILACAIWLLMELYA